MTSAIYRTEVTFWFSSDFIPPTPRKVVLNNECPDYKNKREWYMRCRASLTPHDPEAVLENLYRVEVETYLVETTHLSSQEFEA